MAAGDSGEIHSSTTVSSLEMAETNGSSKQGAEEVPEPAESEDPWEEDEFSEFDFEEEEADTVTIADPLESVNRAFFKFNDKLYFWVLKPVSTGYKKVVPKVVRTGLENFFGNLAGPIRIINCTLQGNFLGASAEISRLTVNTILGVGGFFDVASGLDLTKQYEDFGQTLGVYGLGPGFYINWPLLGPSSLRDSVGFVGDYWIYPMSYAPTLISLGVRVYQVVNKTSLTIGDYEALKEMALDPYVALRNAYHQLRLKRIADRKFVPPQKEASP
jgi:phospholipid-binding lipoprotein MlaA